MKEGKAQRGQDIGKVTKNNIVIRRLGELNSAKILKRLDCSIMSYGFKRSIIVRWLNTISEGVDISHESRTRGKPRNFLILLAHNLDKVDPESNELSKSSRYIRQGRRLLPEILTHVKKDVTIIGML